MGPLFVLIASSTSVLVAIVYLHTILRRLQRHVNRRKYVYGNRLTLITPKPAFRALFEIVTTRETSRVVLITEPPDNLDGKKTGLRTIIQKPRQIRVCGGNGGESNYT